MQSERLPFRHGLDSRPLDGRGGPTIDVDLQPATDELGDALERTGGHDWIEELRRGVDREIVADSRTCTTSVPSITPD